MVAYLGTAGVEIVSEKHWGQSITARAPIHIWEKMFNTEFHTFSVDTDVANSYGNKDREFIRAKVYSVPKILDEHIAMVLKTVQMPDLVTKDIPAEPYSGRKLTDKTPVFFNTYTTIALINKRYEIPDHVGHPQATQTAVQLYNYMFSPEDLTEFQKKFNMTYSQPEVTIENADYVQSQQYCFDNFGKCSEPAIDYQYMMGISNSPTYLYHSDYESYAQTLLGLIAQRASRGQDPPLIINISYGINEKYVSVADAMLFQETAIKLSALGCTIIVSAGDDGVIGRENRDNNICDYGSRFPVSCPYVVSVGSTQVGAGPLHFDEYLI